MGIAPADTPKLGLLAGLAVAEAVESCIPLCSARIKWPNDVLVAGKKIAGILVENSISQNSIGQNSISQNSNGQPFGRIVIGIGVNVATKFDRAEDEIRKRAGSLIELGQRFVTRRQVLDATLERFFTNLGPLRQTTSESADDEHLQNESQHRTSTPAFALAMAAIRRRCFLTGHFITMNHGGEQISGCCEGIDDSGAIVIESEKGRRVLQSGEVVRVQIRKD
jgi:BirA family transcriptional regulator, biotin operon repressor / biotin---[acetyl-CoA-carboxylase] ligase